MTGVRTTCGPMRAAAATTSEKSGSAALKPGPSRQLVCRREKLPSVELELADGFADVRQGLVFALLDEAADDVWSPAPRQFLERAHVEIAIVEELLERRHVTC